MIYGTEAQRYMKTNRVTKEVVEYVLATGDEKYEDDDVIVVVGSDASGRRFRVTASPDRTIIDSVRSLP